MIKHLEEYVNLCLADCAASDCPENQQSWFDFAFGAYILFCRMFPRECSLADAKWEKIWRPKFVTIIEKNK